MWQSWHMPISNRSGYSLFPCNTASRISNQTLLKTELGFSLPGSCEEIQGIRYFIYRVEGSRVPGWRQKQEGNMVELLGEGGEGRAAKLC